MFLLRSTLAARTLALAVLATSLAFGSSASAKEKTEKKKPARQAARTWKTVVDYVFANGTARPLKAPLSRNLGFDSDEIATIALRYKSDDTPDKMTHALHVISAKDKEGKSYPAEFVLGNRISVQKDGVKSIDDFFLRTDLNGRIIAAFTSKGPAGHVIENKLAPDSPEAIATFKAEAKMHLKTMDLQKLSK